MEKYGTDRQDHKGQYNTAHARQLKPQTHTQTMQRLSLFPSINGYANAPYDYVVLTYTACLADFLATAVTQKVRTLSHGGLKTKTLTLAGWGMRGGGVFRTHKICKDFSLQLSLGKKNRFNKCGVVIFASQMKK